MKTIILLLVSITSFGQKDTIKAQIRKDRAAMFGTIALITTPAIIIYNSSDTKGGKLFNGISALGSISCALLSLSHSKGKTVARNALFAFAGAMDAFSEELQFHYPQVKSKLPFLNDQYFDPSISWKNKYSSNLPFAETLLVSTTDGYHASRAISKLSFVGGVLLLDFNKPFKKQLKQIAIGSLLYVTTKGIIHQTFKN